MEILAVLGARCSVLGASPLEMEYFGALTRSYPRAV